MAEKKVTGEGAAHSAPEIKATHYLCAGRVRDWCGHRHESLEAAEACIARDKRACRRQGGYTDRRIYLEAALPLNACNQPIWSRAGDPVPWEEEEEGEED